MSYYLKHFQIENFRSCRSTSLLPNSRLSVIVGKNGAGKTNILNALLLFQRSIKSSKPEGHFEVDEDDKSYMSKLSVALQIEDKHKLIIEINVRYRLDEQSREKIESVNHKISGTFIDKELNLSLGEISAIGDFPPRIFIQEKPDGSISVVKKEVEEISKDVRERLKKAYDFIRGIKYYSATSYTNPSSCPTFFELEDDRPSFSYHSRLDRKHYEFLVSLYRFWNSNKIKYNQFEELIGKDGLGLIDEIAFQEVLVPKHSISTVVGGSFTKKINNRKFIIPYFIKDGITLSPNQLSEGTFKSIALVFYLLTDTSSVLLIEEPEICVHPGLLSKIISLIKEFSAQKTNNCNHTFR